MWMYEKKLEYPVRVFKNDIGMAKFLMAQYGGPDSELSAGVRYLTQRYSMPTNKTKGLLTSWYETVTNRLVPIIKCTMKKELSPEQLKVKKAIRVMIQVAKRILEDEKKNPRQS